MASKKYTVAELSNAFSTGNGGGNFERHIQAIFVLALLVEGFSPIIDESIEQLEFQAKHLGYAVDDLVVISSSGTKLLCQMKHSLAVTKNDSVFQEVINAAWHDFSEDTLFDEGRDKIALITSFIAKDSIHALRYIHDQSLAALSAQAFVDRIYQANFTSQGVRNKFEVIRECLQRANGGIPISNESLWKFCRCFTLSIFDLDYEDSVNRTLAQSLIHCKAEKDAKLVWGSLANLCGTWNQRATTITRNEIPSEYLELFGYTNPKKAVANVSAAFIPNDLWAMIALIGSWDENNEYDIKAIEQIAGKSYNDVQHDCQNLLLSNSENLTLQDGKWKISNRREVIDLVRDYYFDSTIKSAFRVANSYIRETSKQFSKDDELGVVIPATGRFKNSDGFRRGLVEGLCILANGTSLNNCTDDLLVVESKTLIRDAFVDQNWIGLVSMSDLLSGLAEMNPYSYLESLESLIRCKPHEIEKLFPTKQGRMFSDHNFISSILFTLEELAWDGNYIVQCIRCLGELECLNYEQTNWVNTPINTIINILIPFLPQTCAPVEKQKNAVQSLKIEHHELYWSVLTKLLPDTGSVTIRGTARPRFLNIDIPEEISISNEDRYNLFQYYIQQALSMAGTDITKLAQLSEHTSYMQNDDILLLLEKIRAACALCSDEERCGIWIKLCELKYQAILENEKLPPDTELFRELCSAIDDICPQNIMYRHRRLYLSHLNEFLLEEKHWEAVDKSKQNAVEEIYQTFGLHAAIEFGESIDALHEVGSRLGRSITATEFSKIIPEYRTGNYAVFFSSLARAFFSKNGITSIQEIEIKTEEPAFIARVLKAAPFEQGLIDIVPEYLTQNEALFWETVDVPPYYAGHFEYDVVDVIHVLLSYHRAPAAVQAVGQSVEKINIEDDLLCRILMQAPIDGDASNIDRYSVQKIIKHLQNSGKIDIYTLSDIEYIYLPWLDEHSPIKPRAINYRLANEPEYFCFIMENTYKKRHGTSSGQTLSPAERERLFQLTYCYHIIPGTDWDGVFQSDVFVSWLTEVRNWAIENDRYEVTMQTIGEGLSYAKFDNSGIIDTAIMKELNSADNDELRKGYRLGIFNQRGVHWIDPEGKPEKELAQKYNQRAEAAEVLGYSRFSDVLRKIAEGYLSEAKQNAKWCREEEEWDA